MRIEINHKKTVKNNNNKTPKMWRLNNATKQPMDH